MLKKSTKIIGLIIFAMALWMPTGDIHAKEEFRRFALGADLGYHNTGSSEIGEVDANFDAVPFAGLSGIFFVNKSFSIELSTRFLETELEVEFDDNTGKLGDIRQTPIFVTARYQHPIRKSNTNVYFGVGANYSINSFDQESQPGVAGFFPLNIRADINSSFGWHANLGAEMFFKNRFSVYLDLKVVFNKAEFDLVYPDLTEETTDVAMNASILGVGFHYNF